MANLKRYFFHPEGMRLDLSQEGAKVRGEWIKFDDAVAVHSTSTNKSSFQFPKFEEVIKYLRSIKRPESRSLSEHYTLETYNFMVGNKKRWSPLVKIMRIF